MRPPASVLASLESKGITVQNNSWKALRGGRTNRVWAVEASIGRLVCKLFDPSGSNPLYPNLPHDEYLVLHALAGQNIAPEPIAQFPTEDGQVLVYRYVEGQSGQFDLKDIAVLLAKIHTQTSTENLRRVPSGSSALIQQTRQILGQCHGSIRKTPMDVGVVETAPILHPVLIHTDVVPNNIISTVNGLRLIDWQCPATGDPCEDIASFLSPSMQNLYGAAPLSADQIATFLAAYDRPDITTRYRRLAPFFHWRAAAYCLWKTEQGFDDYRPAVDLELSAQQEACRQYDKTGDYHTDADVT